jgi:hypothetical protein
VTVTPCIPLEELAAVADLPASDPRRAHVAQCPRCGALLDAYARFLEPGAEADAAPVGAADVRLSEFLARTIGVPATPAATPAPARAPARTAPRASWWAALFAPAMRPALGFVVAAIVLGGIVVWPRLAGRGPTDALRGGSQRTAVLTLRITDATLGVEGLRMAWDPVAEADTYEVRVYSDALAEIARLNANGDTMLIVPPSELSFRPVPGQSLLVRVDARRQGEVIASSPPLPLSIVTTAD